jgi:hypothetical protein
MGWDFWLEVDTGGEQLVSIGDSVNHTHNTNGMWRLAGLELKEADGKLAAEVGPLVTAAVGWMLDNESLCRPMEPPNGWGTYESTVSALERVAELCADHPKATCRTCF